MDGVTLIVVELGPVAVLQVGVMEEGVRTSLVLLVTASSTVSEASVTALARKLKDAVPPLVMFPQLLAVDTVYEIPVDWLPLFKVVPPAAVTVKAPGIVPSVTGMVWFVPSVAAGLTVMVVPVVPLCRLQVRVAGEGLTTSAVAVDSVVCTVACASAAPAASKVMVGAPVVKFVQPVVVDTVYVMVVDVEALRVCDVDGEIVRPAGTVGTVTARVEVPVSVVTGDTTIVAEA
jgi:hypothetical protein